MSSLRLVLEPSARWAITKGFEILGRSTCALAKIYGGPAKFPDSASITRHTEVENFAKVI